MFRLVLCGIMVVGGVLLSQRWALAQEQAPIPATKPANGLGDENPLAEKYPGDVGIERDPAVLFTDNFEAGTIEDLSRKWQAVGKDAGKVLAFSEDVPDSAAGHRSIEVTGTLGQNSGGYLYTNFRGVDRAFVRFYTKFAPDHGYEHHFVELGGYQPAPPWPNPRAGSRPAGNERMLVFIDPVGVYGKYPPPGVWQLYTYWSEMKISADRHYWGNCLAPAEPQQIPRGKWQCVELMVQMNSAPDRRDGELALWVDGKLAMHVRQGIRRGPWSGMGFDVLKDGGEPFEGLLLRNDERLKINHLWLEHYVDAGAQRQNRVQSPNPVNRVWFDDVVVSTRYVGPIQGSKPAGGQPNPRPVSASGR